MPRSREVLAVLSMVAASHIASAQVLQPEFTGLTLGPAWQDVRGGDTKSRQGWSLAVTTGHGLAAHLAVVVHGGVTRFQGVPQQYLTLPYPFAFPCPSFGCQGSQYSTTGTASVVDAGAGLQAFTDVARVRFLATVSPEANWLTRRDIGTGGFAQGVAASVSSAVSFGGLRLTLQLTTRRLFSSGNGPHSIRALSIGVAGF
jgi:hypothetical protein